MEKRPNVFPTNTQQQQYQQPEAEQPQYHKPESVINPDDKVYVNSDYEAQRMSVANEIYSSSMMDTNMSAIDAMRKRTEEQIKKRDEQLKKNMENIQNYQNNFETFNQQSRQPNPQPQPQTQPQMQTTQLNNQPTSPISNTNLPTDTVTNSRVYIQQLSQPQFNTAFDVIPLPSEGKIYKNKKPAVKVAYMTTADENILTSPNLLQSGEFLEILINRKLLETDLRYKDLHIGDRNAIMLWLRATSYGEMYAVTLYDEDNVAFDTEIDLTSLKTKKLNVEPDSEGYFDFQLPVSKANIKFKLLTVGDVEEVERLIELEKENELPVSNAGTYTLEKQIVEVNGQRDKNIIRDFIQSMRIKDAKELRNYINTIDCGVDLEIEVATPRGGSIKTFLPLNFSFFWPDFSI